MTRPENSARLQSLEEEREAILTILRLFQSDRDLHALMSEVTAFLREWSGCDAVGIRLREGEDFPYFETRGLPEDFVRAESRLCEVDSRGEVVRDSQGNPVLECMCGNVLRGRFDPSKPFFTGHGSFWTNSTTRLLASTSETDRAARTRNRCNGEGYESVALVPLRCLGEIFGLLQCNDKREGRFTPERIAFLEHLADTLAIGLAQRKAADALRASEVRFRTIADFTHDWEYWRSPEGRLVYNSPACERITGYRASDFDDDPGLLDAVVHPDDRAMVQAHVRDMLRDQRPGELDYRVRTRDGDERWISHRCQPVRDNTGRYLGVRVSNRDITEQKRAEGQLRCVNERLAFAQQAAGAGFWDWDIPGGHIAWSAELFRLFGLDPARDIASFDSWRAVLHPDDRQAASDQIDCAIRDHIGLDSEYRIIRPDGDVRWINAVGRTVYDPEGRPLRMSGICVDITSRKRIELGRDRLAHLARRLTTCVTLEEIAQAVREESDLLLAWDAFYFAVRPEGGSCMEACLLVDTVEGRKQTFPGETWLPDATGEPALVNRPADTEDPILPRFGDTGRASRSLLYAPMWYNNEVVGIISVQSYTAERYNEDDLRFLQQIADTVAPNLVRIRAEVALRRSEAEYRQIVEAAQEGIWSMDSQRRTTYVNRRMAEMLGREPADILGRHVTDFMFAEDLPAHEERMIARSAGAPGKYEQRFRRPDGTAVWCLVSATSLTDDEGRFLGSFAMVTDITERRRSEEALRKTSELLEAIRTAQSAYILRGDSREVFDALLHALVSLTDSEFGFLDEVLRDGDGTPYKLSLALSNIAWTPETQRLYELLRERRLEFRNLQNLAGLPALTGEAVIANDASNDPRAGGLPPGHPPLKTFMGLPLRVGGEIVGVAGIANRVGGYDPDLARFLEPFLNACSSILQAVRLQSRKREAVAALRESEERFRLAMDAVNEGLWDWHMPTGRLYRSPGFYAMLGYAVGEIADSFDGWAELLHPDDRSPVLRILEEYIAGGRPRYEVEFRMKARSGDWRWILSRGHIVERDADGRPERMIGTHIDITDRKQAEQTVAQHRAEIKAIYDNAPVMMCVVDEARNVLYVNRAFSEFVGTPPEDLQPGRACGAIGCVHALDDPRGCGFGPHCETCSLRLALKDTATTGAVHRGIEYQTTLLLGGERRDVVLLGSTAPIQYAGKPNMLLCLENITDRKRAEERLRESEQRLQLAIRATNDVVWDWDVLNDAQMWSEAGTVVFGWSDIVQRPQNAAWWTERVHPDDHPRVVAGFHAAVDDPSCCRWQDEYRFRKSDGSYAVVFDRGFIMRDDRGRAVRMIGAMLDITARKQAEDSLRRLEAAVEQAGDIVVITDTDGVIRYVNSAFERITGYGRAEAVGNTPRILKSGVQDDALYRDLWATITAGRPWEGRFVNRRKDGTLYHEKASISPIRSADGTLTGFVAVKRDVTHEDRIHAQLMRIEKMETLGTLAAGMAHSLGNILRVIRGHAAHIRELDGGASRPPLRAIERLLDQAIDLTRSLLAIGREPADRRDFLDLRDVLREARELLANALPARVRLAVRDETRGPCRIRGDQTELQSMLLDLAVNARDAMPDGGAITVRLEGPTLDRDEIPAGPHLTQVARITVSDTGTGIAPELLEKVFEPFFTTKPRTLGSGLGLSVVHGIVTRHGGRIDVRSQPGAGTTFTITLPCAGEEAASTGNPAPGHGERVLLSHHDPYVRATIASFLESIGYQVQLADASEDVAACARDARPHLVLLAPGLPFSDWSATIGHMRALYGELPVIVLTAQTAAPSGLADERTATLFEPFSLFDLAQAAHRALRLDRTRKDAVP